MPGPRRHTMAEQGKMTDEEDTMSSTSCAAEASGLADTLQLLNEKRQEKISKLFAQGERLSLILMKPTDQTFLIVIRNTETCVQILKRRLIPRQDDVYYCSERWPGQ